LSSGFPVVIEMLIRFSCVDAFAKRNKIAYEVGVPTRYLEPVLRHLVHDGILVGQTGPAGGYRLAKPPADITVGDVYRSFRRSSYRRSWLSSMVWPTSKLGNQLVDPLERIDARMMAELDAVTLTDLIEGAYIQAA
jgi:Rrf2 family transcriptional regulator, iron-sulfur cluster assembly transcription factor